MPDASATKNLIGLSREELTAELVGIGEKAFRSKQLWHWIYHQGETDFDKMTTLGKPLREKLKESYVVWKPEIVTEQLSEDTTHKWLLRTQDGNEVEAVFIPEDGRGALCLSSQVGCTLTCSFCYTGTQKLVRNLTAAEMAEAYEGLRFTTYEESIALFGTPDDPGPFKEVFDTVMQLNIEQGVADKLLVYEDQVDASLLVGLFDGHKR